MSNCESYLMHDHLRGGGGGGGNYNKTITVHCDCIVNSEQRSISEFDKQVILQDQNSFLVPVKLLQWIETI